MKTINIVRKSLMLYTFKIYAEVFVIYGCFALMAHLIIAKHVYFNSVFIPFYTLHLHVIYLKMISKLNLYII